MQKLFKVIGTLIILLTSLVFSPSLAKADLSYPAQVIQEFGPSVIPAGAPSVFKITLSNPNAFNLVLSNTPPAIQVTLPPEISILTPITTTTTCGGTVSVTGSTISLIGGSVPAQVGLNLGVCNFTVVVTSTLPGNHNNTIGDSVLHATDPTGTIQVTNTTPSTITLRVTAVQPPSLSKTFSANTIFVGQTSTLAIHITNNDLNSALTKTSLVDSLPTNVALANSSFTSSNCGNPTVTQPDGSAISAGSTVIKINNAAIPLHSVCTVNLTVTSVVPGTYLNTIPANSIQTQQGVTNSTAASAPLNVQQIGLTKAFSPTNVQVGGVSHLTITLQNPSNAAYTGVSFTDTLPAGMTVASPANFSTTCNGTTNGIVSTNDSQEIKLTGGTIPASSSCTVKADVTISFAGSYTNTISAGALQTDQGATNTLPASANLSVYGQGAGLSASKSFSPSTIAYGGSSRLTINLSAPGDTDLHHVNLTDALPAGVTVSSNPNPTINANCGSGTFLPAAGDSLLSFSGGTIPAGKQCSITVNVVANSLGTFTNTISPANITNDENRDITSSISGNLTVSGLSVSKSFTPPGVNINGISTLTIKLTNINLVQLDNVNFVDSLPSGILVAPDPQILSTCGGTVTAVGGGSSITLNSGTLPAQVGAVSGICTVNVNVTGTKTGTFTNTIAANKVTGDLHGSTPTLTVSNPAQATAKLTVATLTIGVAKSFSPVIVAGGSTSTLSVYLENTNTTALYNIGFTDQLPQSSPGYGMHIAPAAHTSVGTCGGTITANPGDTSFTFAGGYLNINQSCMLTLDVTMNVNGNLTNTIGVGDVTSSNGASNLQPASWSLQNNPGASVTKAFSNINGNNATLTINIQNLSNFPITGLGLVDTFPAGLTVNTTPDSAQCGGTVTSTANSITLLDGKLNDKQSCSIIVQVQAATAGTYQNCINSGALHSNEGATNSQDACDTLTVTNPLLPPQISKSFSPSSVALGGSSTVSFKITNPNAAALAGITFSDDLPTNMSLASIPNVSQCGGTVSNTGATSLTLTGGSLAANASCTVTASVTTSSAGNFINSSSVVTSTIGGTGNSSSATLTVVAPPEIQKLFAQPSINAGQTSTLNFIITNPAVNTVALTGVGFVDPLPTGISVANPPNASFSTGCGSATFNPQTGDASLTFSGATIAANNNCTLKVDVTAINGGTYKNTTQTVTSTNGGSGSTASDTLTVLGAGLTLQKSTDTQNIKIAGDQINYSYLLTNTGNLTLYAPFTVSDNHIGNPLGTAFNCGSATSLNPGDTISCSSTYTTTDSDIASNKVTNIAVATAQDAVSGGNSVKSNHSSVTVNVAELTIDKTTSTLAYLTVGNKINYSYTLTNTGNVTLYAPFKVSDDHIGTPPGTAFSCGSATSLAPGANVSCTSSYTVTVDDITAGSVKNTAFATGYDAVSGGALVTSKPDSVVVPKVDHPTIVKAFSPATISIGQTSTLTFTILNPNPVPLTGVAFSDIFPAGLSVTTTPAAAQCGGTVSWNSTTNTLAFSGGSVIGTSCSITATVTAGGSGNFVNTTGTVTTANGGSGNTATATLTVVQAAVVTKSFTPNTILQGGTSTLSLVLTNPASNPTTLNGLAFSDPFPAGVAVAGNPNSSATNCGVGAIFAPVAGDTSLSFSGGTLDSGTACTLTVDVTAPNAGVYDNTASAPTSTNGGTGVPSNTATLTVERLADLSISKDDGKTDVLRGEINTYTINVKNAGPSDAMGAHVYDTLPTSLTSITWSCATLDAGASCSSSGSGNISDTVNLPVGATLTYTVSASVASGAATDIVNTASVNPPDGVADGDMTNNIAIDTDHLNLLTITKTANVTKFDTVGTNVIYTYTVTNSGTSTLNPGFNVYDNKLTPTCNDIPASLAPNQSYICTGTHTVTQDDLDSGPLTNQAYATATDIENDLVQSNNADLSIPATQSPALSLTKSIISGDDFTAANQTIGYSYLVKNTGNVTLSAPFAVSDDKVTVDCSNALASLAPQDQFTCTAIYTVLQSDVDSGSVVNVAHATGNFGSSTVTSNSSTQTANAVQTKKLTLVKSITSGSPYSAVGDVINYSYLLKNDGNVTLSGTGTNGEFTVSDDKASVTCPVTPISLLPGGTVTCKAAYTITQNDLDNGSITNSATGHSKFGSTTIDSKPDSQTAEANQNPALTIVKKVAESISGPWNDDEIILPAGEPVYYQITVTNIGNITLTSVDMSDNQCTLTGPSGDSDHDSKLDTNESWVFTCSVTALAGTHLNTATVVTDQTSQASDGASYFGQNPVIGLAKQATSIEKVSTGTYDVTFTFTVQNYGNVPLSNLLLTDDLTAAFPPSTTYSVQSLSSAQLVVNSSFDGNSDKNLLAAGNSINAGISDYVTLVVQVIPASGGPFNNSATVSGISPLGKTVTDVSQDGLNPDSDSDGNPNNNNEPTPIDFGSHIFEPPLGKKTLDSTQMPVMKWTMTWINNQNIVPVHNTVHDPIPTNTQFFPNLTDSGFDVPAGAPAGSTSKGVTCTASGKSVTTLCYYEGPTADNPLGQVIWAGIIAPDYGVTDPVLATNVVTITFSAMLSGNTVVVENTSTVDTDLNGNGETTDPGEQQVASASAAWHYVTPQLPGTGFAPGIITPLPDQDKALAYSNLGDLWMEIPELNLQSTIIGVPQSSGSWDVSWIGNDIGWLNGTAYPTHTGNSVFTGHVTNADGVPGPFATINKLKYGDQIIIHAMDQEYIYEVREAQTISPDNINAVLKHENLPWITLLTCRDYDAKSGTYLFRYLVRAVLVSVK